MAAQLAQGKPETPKIWTCTFFSHTKPFKRQQWPAARLQQSVHFVYIWSQTLLSQCLRLSSEPIISHTHTHTGNILRPVHTPKASSLAGCRNTFSQSQHSQTALTDAPITQTSRSEADKRPLTHNPWESTKISNLPGLFNSRLLGFPNPAYLQFPVG